MAKRGLVGLVPTTMAVLFPRLDRLSWYLALVSAIALLGQELARSSAMAGPAEFEGFGEDSDELEDEASSVYPVIVPPPVVTQSGFETDRGPPEEEIKHSKPSERGGSKNWKRVTARREAYPGGVGDAMEAAARVNEQGRFAMMDSGLCQACSITHSNTKTQWSGITGFGGMLQAMEQFLLYNVQHQSHIISKYHQPMPIHSPYSDNQFSNGVYNALSVNELLFFNTGKNNTNAHRARSFNDTKHSPLKALRTVLQHSTTECSFNLM